MMRSIGLAFMLVVAGCADVVNREGAGSSGRGGSSGSAEPGGDAWSTGSSAGAGGEAWSSGNVPGAGGAGGSSGGGAAAGGSWSIDSDISYGGQTLGELIASVVAFHEVNGGVEHTQVVLTTVPAFCAALELGYCSTQGFEIGIVLELAGTTDPGTYDVSSGTAAAVGGPMTSACSGSDAFAATGTVTFSTIDVSPDGFVEATLDVHFAGFGYVKGTVIAPLCDYDPTP
jgi:hypothetical protein